MNIVSTRRTEVFGDLIATDSDGIEYTVEYSQRQDSYYIADSSGEPVSAIYETREDAEKDMVSGLF